MFSTYLPTPNPIDVKNFERDADALRAAISLRNDLARGIHALHPYSIAALARQLFPGQPDFHAIAKSGLEASAMFRDLAAHGDDVRSVMKAEKARLAPAMSAAVRRTFEIATRLPVLANALRNNESTIRQRRERLASAGVTGDDLERLTSANDIGPLIAEQAALHVENEALHLFIATSDERHLPPGFSIPDSIKVSVQRPSDEIHADLKSF